MKIMHAYSDRAGDLYETAPVAVRALLDAEWLPSRIWEPACGPGAIVHELRLSGRTVVASDIIDHGCPGQTVADFLRTTVAPRGVDCIVTNPPYRFAAEFVEHGLALCPRVVMLLRLAFLDGGTGTRRASLARQAVLDGGQLARVHQFRERLPMMHRAGWDGPIATSSTAFAWFVWDRSWRGPTHMHRISWKPFADAAQALPMAAE